MIFVFSFFYRLIGCVELLFPNMIYVNDPEVKRDINTKLSRFWELNIKHQIRYLNFQWF